VVIHRMNNRIIRSKSNKKEKVLKQFKSLLDRDNMSKKMGQLERLEELQRKQSTVVYNTAFSKDRVVSYFLLLFLPPYGLYRIWHKKSTFNTIEKYLWTFISIMSLVKFMELIT
jgi:hypothetical protein